ncbi:hypothetical protein [Natronosalvus vescus]|uniref:hypothetical protein n=1 Tax=Natronosalvus vescus TaxID=2953881 RepID=UPI0020909CF5|nr:hypothetical protein [Natronosalvus vescus]
MAEAQRIQWRRDTSTSRTVRTLWSLGVGTFFATITIIVFWRLFMLTGQAGTQVLSITVIEGVSLTLTTWQVLVVGVTLGVTVTILALGVSRHPGAHLRGLASRLSLPSPGEGALQRAVDAAVGTVVMMAILGGLIGAARVVSQGDLLAVGAGPFTFVAALSIPLALLALVLASFLSSVGTIDEDDGALYLFDPEERIALEHLEAVSVRAIGETAIVSLEYAQPDGQYVPGPRRLVVPLPVARELEGVVSTSSQM